jgi:hypothetical protein
VNKANLTSAALCSGHALTMPCKKTHCIPPWDASLLMNRLHAAHVDRLLTCCNTLHICPAELDSSMHSTSSGRLRC